MGGATISHQAFGSRALRGGGPRRIRHTSITARRTLSTSFGKASARRRTSCFPRAEPRLVGGPAEVAAVNRGAQRAQRSKYSCVRDIAASNLQPFILAWLEAQSYPRRDARGTTWCA